jgi:hypothetical protein
MQAVLSWVANNDGNCSLQSIRLYDRPSNMGGSIGSFVQAFGSVKQEVDERAAKAAGAEGLAEVAEATVEATAEAIA